MALLVPGTRYLLRTIGDFEIREINVYIRVIQIYLTFVSINCSTWNWCTLSIDRMSLVVWPTSLLVRRVSYREALVVSFVSFICGSVINGNAYVETENSSIINTSTILVCVILIPFFILFLTSLMILYKLKSNSKRVSPNGCQNNQEINIYPLKMNIMVSIYYIITTIPYGIIMLMKYGSWKSFSDSYSFNAIYNGATTLTISNASMKFFIYNLSTRHMRQTLIEIFHKMQYRAPKIGIKMISKNET